MNKREVIIVGGGIAGLTAGIHLADRGVEVLLFEKESFPQHKVCGEYLSREVLPYFDELEIPLLEAGPKKISRLIYSTKKGNFLETSLEPGGLGISRYALDELLYRTALERGVEVKQEKVKDIHFGEGHFSVETSSDSYQSKHVLGAFGKRSNLDKELNREFFKNPAPWVGIKSHYYLPDFPDDLVGLHNFKGGYCGLSKTETGAVNVCFLATYKSFKDYKDPQVFTEKELRKNPFLNTFFTEATPLFEQPLSIAQISFSSKEIVKDHILMVGDSAGLIHPLCGNGMAMAVQGAKIASEVLLSAFNKAYAGREQMETDYRKKWEKEFRSRLNTGKWLQKILLKENLAEVSQALLSKMPFLLPEIIKRTHGRAIG